jgi:hypothetical protein
MNVLRRLLIPGLLLACVESAAFELLPVQSGLAGAGCTYLLTDDPQERPVLVAEARSRERPQAGSVRMRVAAHDLHLTPDADRPATAFAGDGWQVEVLELLDDGSPCAGAECEGSWQRGRLRISGPVGERTVEVRVHCGA